MQLGCLTLGEWLCHLPDQLRLLTRTLLAESRTCVGAAGSNLCLPADGPSCRCDGPCASRRRTCQTLFTGIPTSSSVSSKSWCVVSLGRALGCLRQRCCHTVWHWQTRRTGLRSKRLRAGGVAWGLLILPLFSGRRWQVVEEVELVTVTEVALSLRLCQLLWWRWVTALGRRGQVSAYSKAPGRSLVHLTTNRHA
jgi:hypothetical protein